MAELQFQHVGVTLEAFFKEPVILQDAQIPLIAKKALQVFGSYGLKPPQISMNAGDRLYNYELTVSLFNGSGAIRISSERMLIDFKNIVSKNDVDIVATCLVSAFDLPLTEIARTNISTNTHATMSSVEDVQRYLRRNAKPDIGVVSLGTLAVLRCDPWPEEIKLMIDQSLVFPNGLFLSWSTVQNDKRVSRGDLDVLGKLITDSLSKFELEVAK